MVKLSDQDSNDQTAYRTGCGSSDIADIYPISSTAHYRVNYMDSQMYGQLID